MTGVYRKLTDSEGWGSVKNCSTSLMHLEEHTSLTQAVSFALLALETHVPLRDVAESGNRLAGGMWSSPSLGYHGARCDRPDRNPSHHRLCAHHSLVYSLCGTDMQWDLAAKDDSRSSLRGCLAHLFGAQHCFFGRGALQRQSRESI